MGNKFMRKKGYTLFAVGCSISTIFLLSGCGGAHETTAPPVSGGKIKVVAAENFYGEVAQAIGGDRVDVTTILKNDVDPHDYEPTIETSKLVNDGQVIIYNGAGYDEWIDKVLIAGSSTNSKSIVKVAEDIMGKKEGDNEHVWYDPSTMPKLADQIADNLAKLDPTQKEAYHQRAQAYITSLNPLKERVEKLKQASATEIDVSEPIFDYMAEALNLKINDSRFAKAVDEGTDPSPADYAALQNDFKEKKVKLFVQNIQNSSPTVDNLIQLAHANGIPVVQLTETEPKGKNYVQWMTDQLDQVAQALSSK
jgi:zinc/manganese transport system substrate-binding protein